MTTKIQLTNQRLLYQHCS